MNRSNNSHLAHEGSTLDPRQTWLAQFDLATWGIEDVAYVKPVDGEQGEAYGIFAADGTELAQMDNRDEAIVTIRQNDLQALSVH